MTLPTVSPADQPATPPLQPPVTPFNLPALDSANGRNGSASFVPSRLPQPQRWSWRKKVLVTAGVFLGITGAVVTYWMVRNPHQARTDLVTHRVKYEKLELTIVERGALESAKNSDIYCNVKAGTRGGTTASTIKWVIDDGSSVKKGALLVDLDDSGLQDQLKNQKITVDKAEADKIKSEEDFKIQLSQNESDIKSAEVNLQLSTIDLQKYKEGDYPQQLKIFEGNIKQAESDVEQQRDRVAWANRMVKKGYLTVTQSQGEQSKLESLQITLAKAMEDRRVLTDPVFGTGMRQITFLQNDVSEKMRALERVKSQAKAKEVQAMSAREAMKSVYAQALAQHKEIEDEIKKCKIYSPQDGMVVYFVPEQARGGGGSQQSIVAQGEPVREGQKLMQIPNLRRMLVNTKVHEAMVSRVTSGQPAQIRVDSFPDRILHGHVDLVATVSSQQDFYSTDVKVYTTKVRIDDSVDNLKPGMSAEVTIAVGDALEHVLAVPIQAIIGSAEMGRQRKCFVVTPEGPQERDIMVGQSNERMAEIKEGVQEGEEVVLNPKALVGDKAKTRQPTENRKGNGDTAPDSDSPAPKGKDKKKMPTDSEKRPMAAREGVPVGEGSGGNQFKPEDRKSKSGK